MMGGLRSGPGPNHRPIRALPEWAVDKLVFGLGEDRGSDPARSGGSASDRDECLPAGWTRNEFVDEVTKCEKKKDARGRKRWTEHRLWVQLRSYNNSPKAAFNALDKAWEAAVANLNGVGMRTKEEIHDDAVERAFLWADRITDGVDGLTETEAAVIGYVTSETERRGMMRVTCPARAVGEYAKVSAMTASRTLAALTEKGLLVRYSPGRPGKVGNRKADIYGLVDPDTCQHRKCSPVSPPSPLLACQSP